MGRACLDAESKRPPEARLSSHSEPQPVARQRGRPEPRSALPSARRAAKISRRASSPRASQEDRFLLFGESLQPMHVVEAHVIAPGGRHLVEPVVLAKHL